MNRTVMPLARQAAACLDGTLRTLSTRLAIVVAIAAALAAAH